MLNPNVKASTRGLPAWWVGRPMNMVRIATIVANQMKRMKE